MLKYFRLGQPTKIFHHNFLSLGVVCFMREMHSAASLLSMTRIYVEGLKSVKEIAVCVAIISTKMFGMW